MNEWWTLLAVATGEPVGMIRASQRGVAERSEVGVNL
jgi:hypothetical protein